MSSFDFEIEIQISGGHEYHRSIVDSLLYDIVSTTPEGELLPFEKLFVALNSKHSCHAGYLTDVYMACGCFDKAMEYYSAIDHQRKLGDISWISGDCDGAERHYMTAHSGAQSYRNRPDYDRLIKLAFFREQWDAVVRLFSEAEFSPGFSAGNVGCGNSEISARPFLEMLAVALLLSKQEVPEGVQAVLKSAFRLTTRAWNKVRSDAEAGVTGGKLVEKIKKRCVPQAGRRARISVDEALERGATSRARDVLACVAQGDDLVKEAKSQLEIYARTGDDRPLEHFFEIVTRSGLTSLSHTFLNSVMLDESLFPQDTPPERLVKLYSANPVMNKRHFGRLLQLKFDNRIALTGSDIVTGMFQQLYSFNAILEPESVQESFGVSKLAGFREWTEMRLADWIAGCGAEGIKTVCNVWRSGDAEAVKHPFGGSANMRPATPRDMAEWGWLLNSAAQWLRARWGREVGTTAWVSENQLYQLLKRQLKGVLVQQHARPTWVAPQHLDVFMPERSLAVEYMGKQHFEPVELFGGQAGFQGVQERDRKKREACLRHGVELIQVRYDEDMGSRVKQIIETVRSRDVQA
jgi:hypothetical protein